jgi:hypothetical protein
MEEERSDYLNVSVPPVDQALDEARIERDGTPRSNKGHFRTWSKGSSPFLPLFHRNPAVHTPVSALPSLSESLHP